MDMAKKRTYKSQLREQSKAITLENILSVAVQLHGKGVTSVEDIAKEAGVSVATIRKYFPTREDLFKGCTEHFAKTHSIPSLYEMSLIDDPAERLAATVRQVYGLFETALGQNWLAYRLQDESFVMAATVMQMETVIRAAVDILLRDWHPNDADIAQEDIPGFVRGLLSPLTYRSLRLFGGLQPEQCYRQTMMTIAGKLAISHLQVEEVGQQPYSEKMTEGPDSSEGRKKLKTVNLNKLPLLESWYDNDPSAKWKVNMPFAPLFPAWTGIETDSLSAVIFDLEPGHKLGEHTDNAEELVVVLNGTVEASLDGVKERLSQGEMLIIPAMVPHEIRNVGEDAVRCLGFFASKQVTSSFTEVVSPMGGKTFGPDQPQSDEAG